RRAAHSPWRQRSARCSAASRWISPLRASSRRKRSLPSLAAKTSAAECELSSTRPKRALLAVEGNSTHPPKRQKEKCRAAHRLGGRTSTRAAITSLSLRQPLSRVCGRILHRETASCVQFLHGSWTILELKECAVRPRRTPPPWLAVSTCA